jgi:hypothetical protein
MKLTNLAYNAQALQLSSRLTPRRHMGVCLVPQFAHCGSSPFMPAMEIRASGTVTGRAAENVSSKLEVLDGLHCGNMSCLLKKK